MGTLAENTLVIIARKMSNATERVIGNWRIRSRSVGGFKSWSVLANAFILCNATPA